jgi:hypothetical protein
MAYSDQQGKVKNWAGSNTVRERFKKEVLPLMEETRSQRSKLNLSWSRYHKAWTKEHEFQAYLGKSNIYLPTTKRGVETKVSQAVAATFPGDEFFIAEPERAEYSAMTADVQALEQNRVEAAKVRMHAEAHYRQLYMKGNAPGRIHWKEKVFSTDARKKAVKTEEELYGSMETQEAYAYSGPCFTPIPAEDFYAWPPTVSTLEEADGVFEDYITTKRKLKMRADAGFFDKEMVENIVTGASNSDKDAADAARMSDQGITPPQQSDMKQEYVACSHVFLDFDPEAESEDASKNLRPFHFTVTHDGKVLRAVEAKHTSPGACHPYVLGRIGQITGRLWGSGDVEDIYPLQLLLNDQVNQAMDNATWSMNPGIVSNPNVLMTAITEFEPGFQVLATDVNNALKEFRPPDMIQSSSLLMTQTMSWLQEMLGASPVLSGGSTPGRAFRSATGVGVANQNAQLPIQQVVRLQEIDVFQPMLKGFWNLDKAFAKDEVLIRAGGPNLPPARSVDPKSLFGEYRFRWSASTQMMNVQVRGQQIMQALQVLSNPQTAGMLAQMGIRINLAPLINRLLRDVFGFRDAEQILVQGPSPMPPDMQPGQPQPGQPGQEQPAGDPGANPLAGANMEDPSGGFGAVRMEANDIAGAFGQLGPGTGPAMEDFEEEPFPG